MRAIGADFIKCQRFCALYIIKRVPYTRSETLSANFSKIASNQPTPPRPRAPPFLAGSKLTARYGVSLSTLRKWHADGHVEALRLGDGGKRLYNANDVRKRLGVRNEDETTASGRKIIYARVSSSQPRGDLHRQVLALQAAYPGFEVIKDIASGVDFKRPGLRALLEAVVKREVRVVVVAHSDRLARLGFDLIESVLGAGGACLMVHASGEVTDSPRDLADDLLAVTALFAHGGDSRAAQNRKRRRADGAAGHGHRGEAWRAQSPVGGADPIPEVNQ